MMRADTFLGRVVAALARSTPSFRPAYEFDVTPRIDLRTGLLNALSWSNEATRKLALSDQSGRPVGLLMVDLDHFKSVNDRWGHLAGDTVLAAIGGLLRFETERDGLVGRFGGEEFVALLPNASVELAMLRAEHIRARIAALSVPVTDTHGEPAVISGLTASIGVSGKPWHADSLDELLQAADSAVYMAKAGGRNQVRAAGRGEVADEDDVTPRQMR